MSRAVEGLVWLYPPTFRRRYGAEMVTVLRDAARGARNGSPFARLTDSARVVLDLLAGAGLEWWSRLGEVARGETEPPAWRASPAWARLRGASPQRTADAGVPGFAPLPQLRRRHAGRALPPKAPSMV